MGYPQTKMQRPAGDLQLVQILDSALAEATRRAGAWLACRPGCTQCCVGAFAINALDAVRLEDGMGELWRTDSARATRIQQRARDYIKRVERDFPGDPRTGLLADDPTAEERFESFANDEPCPALDPNTGMCDLYAYRPMTCRVFGPPVRNDDGNLGTCELCFHGVSNDEVEACEMVPDPDALEERLISEMEVEESRGQTIVAFVLAGQR